MTQSRNILSFFFVWQANELKYVIHLRFVLFLCFFFFKWRAYLFSTMMVTKKNKNEIVLACLAHSWRV
jgi:hypothetical protein